MRNLIHTIAAVVIVSTLAACGGKGNDATVPEATSDIKLHNFNDSLAWVLGTQMGQQFAALKDYSHLQVDKKIVEQAFCNAVEGKASAMDEKSSRIIYDIFQQQIAVQQQKAQQTNTAQISKSEEDLFAKLISEKPNLKKHPSGFYYEVIKQGKGRNAPYNYRIEFDYRGYIMATGKLFDQTYGNREPIVHVLGKPMFQGLQDGLQLMNEGSIYRFYFPSSLAFGAAGSGGGVPPYTPIIYEVELHTIFNS